MDNALRNQLKLLCRAEAAVIRMEAQLRCLRVAILVRYAALGLSDREAAEFFQLGLELAGDRSDAVLHGELRNPARGSQDGLQELGA